MGRFWDTYALEASPDGENWHTIKENITDEQTTIRVLPDEIEYKVVEVSNTELESESETVTGPISNDPTDFIGLVIYAIHKVKETSYK